MRRRKMRKRKKNNENKNENKKKNKKKKNKEKKKKTNKNIMELAILGSVDERIDAAVGEHHHHREIVIPASVGEDVAGQDGGDIRQ